MKKSFLFFVVLASLGLLTMANQCNEDYPEPEPTHKFEEKLILTPYKKEYVVNDTIWVQFKSVDRTLFDKLSNSRINTDTTYLNQSFTYNQRQPDPNDGRIICDIKVEGGQNVNFSSGFNAGVNESKFEIDCASKTQSFRVGFVPRTTGIYYIQPSAYVGGCPGKKAYVRQRTELKLTFDLADCNKDIFLSVPAQLRGSEPDRTATSIDNKELFYFRVI